MNKAFCMPLGSSLWDGVLSRDLRASKLLRLSILTPNDKNSYVFAVYNQVLLRLSRISSKISI